MPSDFQSYLALLKLVDDASKDLGFSHLTASDKHVLLALTAFADKSGEASGSTFARYCDLVGNDNAVSRAQFFKSLDVLLVSRAIEKTGSPRAATYVLAS